MNNFFMLCCSFQKIFFFFVWCGPFLQMFFFKMKVYQLKGDKHEFFNNCFPGCHVDLQHQSCVQKARQGSLCEAQNRLKVGDSDCP